MGLKEYYRAKAKKLAKQVKNHVKRLERMQEEQIAQPRPEENIYLELSTARSSSKVLLYGENLRKVFGKRVLFERVCLHLHSGEKVGIIGPNGCGKTTLLNLLLGLEPLDSGELWASPTLKAGYLDQELLALSANRSIWEELTAQNRDARKVHNLLAGLLFKGDAVHKRCAVLSMGERVRVGLAKLLLGEYPLLVLDEPTNYLDLPSRERLEAMLQQYAGALLVVSHDRYLLNRVCTTIWSIENQMLKIYPGNYDAYQESLQRFKQIQRPEIKLTLELRKARILGELAILDQQRFQQEYQRLDAEFKEILVQLAGLKSDSFEKKPKIPKRDLQNGMDLI